MSTMKMRFELREPAHCLCNLTLLGVSLYFVTHIERLMPALLPTISAYAASHPVLYAYIVLCCVVWAVQVWVIDQTTAKCYV